VLRSLGVLKRDKRQWHLSHFFAVASVGLLAAIVMPGCAWLFGFNQVNPTPTVEPDGGPHGGGLVYPTPAPIITSQRSVFVTAEPGYRSLGGIFVYDGRLMIVQPNRLFDAEHASDATLNYDFGQLVAEHHIDPLGKLTEADCSGAGDRPEAPIQPRKVAVAADEVAAGIACARLRNPGAHWIASRLMASHQRAVAFHLLERMDDGRRIGVYADVTRFAAQGGVLQ